MITTAKNTQDLKEHMGHRLEIAVYAHTEVVIECLDCYEILYGVKPEHDND